MARWFARCAKGLSHSAAAPSTPSKAKETSAIAGMVPHCQWLMYTSGMNNK